MWAAARDTVVRPDFHRLAQRLQRLAGEFGQLVQEQHAAMGQADLAGPRAMAAAGQRGLGRGMVRFPERRAHDQAAAIQHAGDAVDHADLQRRSRIEVGQQARQARGEHGFAGARRSDQQQVVAAGRGDLQRAPGGFHALHVGHVGAGGDLGHAGGGGRRQHLGAAEMVDQAQQVGRRQDVDPAGPGGLAALAGRDRSGRVARRGGDRRRQHAGDRVQRAIQRQFAQRGVAGDLLARQDVHRGEQRQARAAGRNGCLPSAGRRV